MKRLMVLVGLAGSVAFCGWTHAAGVKEDYSIILKRNLFASPAPKPVAPTSILKPPPPPSLESFVEIRGIIFSDIGKSFVFLKRKGQVDEGIYREGEVVDGARIVKIGVSAVSFEYDGKTLTLSLENKISEGAVKMGDLVASVPTMVLDAKKNDTNVVAPVMPNVAPPQNVNLQEAIQTMKNDKDLSRNINVAPSITSEGTVDGYKVDRIPDGSLPYRYGLRNGDVVRRVNGIFIDSIARAASVYQGVVASGSKLITMEVMRNGSPLILTFNLQ